MDYYEYTMQRRINRRAIMGGLRFFKRDTRTTSSPEPIVMARIQHPAQPLKTPCISLQNIYNNQNCTRGLIG